MPIDRLVYPSKLHPQALTPATRVFLYMSFRVVCHFLYHITLKHLGL